METFKKENKTRTVLVSRLVSGITVGEVRDHFSEIGPLKKCFLVRDPESYEFNGLAYVTFTVPEDATKAVQMLDGKVFNGQQINVKFSKHKEKEPMHHEPVAIKEDSQHTFYKRQSTSERNKKKGRIIVRNLSFNLTEDKFKEFFKPCGLVRDVHILKKPDGKSKGVGFVQFKDYSMAIKAIEECNMKMLYGRKMAVDLAIPKKDYDPSNSEPEAPHNPMEILRNALRPKQETSTEEKFNDHNISIKEEVLDNEELMETSSNSIKEEDNEDKGNIKKDSDENKVSVKKDPDENEDRIKEEHDEVEDSGIDEEDQQSKPPPEKKQKIFKEAASKDVMEGRTLFAKNISLDSDEQTIRELFAKYGPVKYVRFCMDRNTESFKGSAFVEYESKEYSDACMEAFSDPACKKDFVLEGRSIFILRAISREDLRHKQEGKDAENVKRKDVRNILLAREGVIREGTMAAKGVSKKDLAMRTQREIIKRKLLANFNTLVSPTRLFVQNLPLTLTDSQLKDIFRINSSNDAAITECRIMRNLHDLDDDGLAKSKGFGFITFKNHSDALHALRTVNNSPTIFTKNQRPIVEFSIENKGALKARENRLIRSKEANRRKSKGELAKGTNNTFLDVTKGGTSTGLPSFVGSKYDPKRRGFKALSTHIGPKIRHRASKDKKITRNAINNRMRRSFAHKNKKGTHKSKSESYKGKKTMKKKGPKGASKAKGSSKKNKSGAKKNPKSKR